MVVLYRNPLYNEACYNEVILYFFFLFYYTFLAWAKADNPFGTNF